MVHTDVDDEVIEINFDQQFCERMECILSQFFHEDLLPEIIDGRIPRHQLTR